MSKPRLKSPILCVFWSLPLFAAVLFDVYIWRTGGIGFHFSDAGYLLQHYLPEIYDEVVGVTDDALYLVPLEIIFRSKTVVLGAIIAAIPILIINRPRHAQDPTPVRRFRR